MLKEILDNSSTKLEITKNAQNRIRDTEQFTNNITRALQSANSLDILLSTAEAVEKNKLMHVSIEPIMKNDIISSIQMIQSQIQESYLDSSAVKDISNNVMNLKRHLDSLWVSSVKSNTEQVISLLKTFGQFMQNKDEAVSTASSLEKNIDSLPANAHDVITYKLKLQKGHQLVEQIGADEEIQIFIRKVSENQATLDDVTDKVHAWVKDHKLEKRIKIRLA